MDTDASLLFLYQQDDPDWSKVFAGTLSAGGQVRLLDLGSAEVTASFLRDLLKLSGLEPTGKFRPGPGLEEMYWRRKP